tara:strand:- start:5127 stop:5405 length:279 start_codon:yes stop_codon:yes gene_type:complete
MVGAFISISVQLPPCHLAGFSTTRSLFSEIKNLSVQQQKSSLVEEASRVRTINRDLQTSDQKRKEVFIMLPKLIEAFFLSCSSQRAAQLDDE